MSDTDSASGSDISTTVGEHFCEVVGRKSWLPYFYLIFKYSLIFGVILGIQATATYHDMTIEIPELTEYSIYVYIALGCLFIYRLAVLRSFKIYVVQRGVYYEEGIRLFPWWRHGDGIRWRDMDMAFYRNNFLSWITNSYTVMINHKYTNRSDFEVTHIWGGKRASVKIEGFRDKFVESD